MPSLIETNLIEAKRVLFFVPRFASGGAEAFIVNLAIRLKEEGWIPTILSVDERPTVYDEKLSKSAINREVLLDETLENPAVLYMKAYSLFCHYMKSNADRFDAIHFNVAQGEDLPFVFIARRAGIKQRILHSHNSSVNSRLKYLGHWVCKRVFSRNETCRLACSELAAQWLFSKNIIESGQYRLVNNGISTKDYKYSETSRKTTRDDLELGSELVYLHVGRQTSQKNPGFLLRAFRKIYENDGNAVLLMVGDGELGDELRLLAEALGISQAVKWLGKRTDIPALMSCADAFLLPSRFEGFPVTLIEAQTAGLPCVVSDNISEECAITDLLVRVPLDLEKFAFEAEKSAKRRGKTRAAYCEIVASKGFDIEQTVLLLKRLY